MKRKKTPSSKKNAVRRTPVADISPDEQIIGAPLLGKVKSYDARSGEMTLRLEEPVSAGDALRVKGKDTDLSQRVERLRVGRRAVQSALAGESVGVRVADRVRPGDAVYKVRSS
ncbi:MAG: hypothetical protein HYZ74_07995 [Elusimicrobia bacterium]|nr:hypothetical protein [Elusimicrobiota bacterium]